MSLSACGCLWAIHTRCLSGWISMQGPTKQPYSSRVPGQWYWVLWQLIVRYLIIYLFTYNILAIGRCFVVLAECRTQLANKDNSYKTRLCRAYKQIDTSVILHGCCTCMQITSPVALDNTTLGRQQARMRHTGQAHWFLKSISHNTHVIHVLKSAQAALQCLYPNIQPRSNLEAGWPISKPASLFQSWPTVYVWDGQFILVQFSILSLLQH